VSYFLSGAILKVFESMLSQNFLEQCAVVRFFTVRRLTPKAIHTELMSTYEEDALAFRTIYKWYYRFKEGRIDLDDDPRPGRLLSDDLTQAITAMIKERPFIFCKVFYHYLRITKHTCLCILHDALGLKNSAYGEFRML
jgi:hypothetical protein